VTTGSRRQSALVVPPGESAGMCDGYSDYGQQLAVAKQGGEITSGVSLPSSALLFFYMFHFSIFFKNDSVVF
jgi:hypothetical protein